MGLKGLATFLVLAIVSSSCPSFGHKLHPNNEDVFTDIVFYDVTSSTISMSWETWTKTLNVNSSRVSRFEVHVADSTRNITSFIKRVYFSSHRFEGLEADTEYSFSLAAILKTSLHNESGVETSKIMTQGIQRTLCTEPPTPLLCLISVSPTKANFQYTISDWNCSSSITEFQRQMETEEWETVLRNFQISSFSTDVLPCSLNEFRVQHVDTDGDELIKSSSVIVEAPNILGGRCATEAQLKQITGACVGAGVVLLIITFYSIAYCHWRLSGGHIPPSNVTDPENLVPNERTSSNNKDNQQDISDNEDAIVNKSFVEDQV